MESPQIMNKIGQELVRTCTNRYQEHLAKRTGGLPATVLELFRVQSYGGMCPKCGRFWVETHVKNNFADFIYYKPDCTCWRTCPGIDQIFTYDGNPIVRRHTVKKSCGEPSFIEQELYGRMECDSCHIEIEAWKAMEPSPEGTKERSRSRGSTRRDY